MLRFSLALQHGMLTWIMNGHRTYMQTRASLRRLRHVSLTWSLIYSLFLCLGLSRHVRLPRRISHHSEYSSCAQVILGKGVDEGRILFLTLIAAPEGIHRICRTFPRVKVQP